MNKKMMGVVLPLIISASAVMADQSNTVTLLEKARESVIKQYIHDLQAADADDISGLFIDEGTVVSTSRGSVNASDFFHSFLSEIAYASTELHGLFINTSSDNLYTARFHFSFNMKNGEKGDGEYVDEFVFATHSEKLLAVYMFENLKFEEMGIKGVWHKDVNGS